MNIGKRWTQKPKMKEVGGFFGNRRRPQLGKREDEHRCVGCNDVKSCIYDYDMFWQSTVWLCDKCKEYE